jgi:hypothetical protein
MKVKSNAHKNFISRGAAIYTRIFPQLVKLLYEIKFLFYSAFCWPRITYN